MNILGHHLGHTQLKPLVLVSAVARAGAITDHVVSNHIDHVMNGDILCEISADHTVTGTIEPTIITDDMEYTWHDQVEWCRVAMHRALSGRDFYAWVWLTPLQQRAYPIGTTIRLDV